MKEDKKILAWAVTDWGGGIKHPSISVCDSKKDAKKLLNELNELPDPTTKGERNKIVRVEIKILSQSEKIWKED